MKSIGFTGTRHGMTAAQKAEIEKRLTALNPAMIIAHHGDCIGADADFHAICRKVGVSWIVAHPPEKNDLRAFTDAEEVREPKDYLVRNADIVNESDEMFATPAEYHEQQRGGTWSTIRRSRRAGQCPTVILPHGLPLDY